MLMNRSVRFGFGGSTVLVASSGDQVSFYTTVGGGWLERYRLSFFHLVILTPKLKWVFVDL